MQNLVINVLMRVTVQNWNSEGKCEVVCGRIVRNVRDLADNENNTMGKGEEEGEERTEGRRDTEDATSTTCPGCSQHKPTHIVGRCQLSVSLHAKIFGCF